MPDITREMMNSYPMSTTGGTISSDLYKRDVPDFIRIVGRSDTPLATLVDGGKSRNMIKWEYGEGDYISRDDTLSAAISVTTDGDISVTERKKYQKWMLIKIDDELLLVTDPEPATAGKITVKRGWGGSTAATHSNAAEVKLLSPAMPEGADAVASPSQQGTLEWTCPQIFEYTWTYTHRGRIVPDYEVSTDKFKERLRKAMVEAARDLDRTMLHGRRNLGDGTKTNPSTMGGLRQFTNVHTLDVSGDPLDFLDIMNTLQKVYKDVGRENMGKTVMGSMMTKRIWNSWFNPTRRSTLNDAKYNVVWDNVETDFGVLRFVTHYDMDDNELYIWNPDDARRDYFEGGTWSTGFYSTQGWYDKGFLRGDYGAIWQAPRRRCRIYNYSKNAASYPNLDKIITSVA